MPFCALGSPVRERLDTLKKKTSLDPICIGFLGRTGAGKSSLLNAMIGKKLLLPVSGEESCTSCIVQVKGSWNDYFEARIHLLSEQEWKDELKKIVEVSGETEDDSDDDGSDEIVNDGRAKLCALYGAGAENKSYEELLQTKLQVTIPVGRVIKIKKKKAKEFSRVLEPYICVRNEGSNVPWPLIKYVEVTIPGSDILPEGIMYVDIPGTGDSNRTRDEMWKQSVDMCSVLWIISDIERSTGEKEQPQLLNAGIKAYVGGICMDIIMVVTKSDKLDLEEYKRRQRNTSASIKNLHDAIIKRNKDVKKNMEDSIRKKLKKRLPSDSELLKKSDLVYTVSTRDFWEAKHLSPKETEIPKLREYIKRIYLREKKNLLMGYIKEARGLLLLFKSFGSKQHISKQHFQESGVEEFMNKETDALEKSLDKCFSQIKQPLCDGVQRARTCYKDIVEGMLTKGTSNRGFHRTLKAVCERNGVYVSKAFARIDFNDNLARPIYDKIDGTFGGIFRNVENSTQATLTTVSEARPGCGNLQQRGTDEGGLWDLLKNFKDVGQKKIEQIGKANKLPNGRSEIETFNCEIDVILTKLRQEILRRKMDIYQSPPVFIQDVLRLHYQEASRVRGLGTCEKMKGIFRKNIKKEVNNSMFEKAKLKMMSSLSQLKEDIVECLKKEISIVLKLIWLPQEQLAVRLPDITEECQEIERLYRELNTEEQGRDGKDEAP
ncbi:nuclear GTPase SLIP-GC-like isoform X2 [Hemicordylus capensis]|uniref:nuclear GTPase SLIP-GC-like isoform X2 n=1 Tax=Hemicordylus capensis TaxID=884348 RepID=UPI002303292A|nr:nuclear GTPase SLIP-GC-like isoform X2 [Hemicordylus capensis]